MQAAQLEPSERIGPREPLTALEPIRVGDTGGGVARRLRTLGAHQRIPDRTAGRIGQRADQASAAGEDELADLVQLTASELPATWRLG